MTDTELKFKGKSNDKDYEVNVEFFESVDSEGSTYKVLPRSIQMHIMKKDKDDDSEFWPRLLKDKALEKNQVKIDWDRYVDEDEEEEAGGFDTSALAGGQNMMGGMPGMEGMMGGMPGMGGGMPGMEGASFSGKLWRATIAAGERTIFSHPSFFGILFVLLYSKSNDRYGHGSPNEANGSNGRWRFRRQQRRSRRG